MDKNLEREFAEYEKHHRRKDEHKAAFLAQKNVIIELLNAGRSMMTIHSFLRDSGRISSSYEAFRLHVRESIEGFAKKPSNKPEKQSVTATTQQESTPPDLDSEFEQIFRQRYTSGVAFRTYLDELYKREALAKKGQSLEGSMTV